jgi:hypothetical protein
MYLDNLTDRELIDRVVKFSTDPIQLKLATIMERMPGNILDDLHDVGMDPTWCEFTDEYGGKRHTGDYIRHLRSEIDYFQNELQELQEKYQQSLRQVEDMKTRPVSELISELHRELSKRDSDFEVARRTTEKAIADRDQMKDKLSMWAKLNGQV